MQGVATCCPAPQSVFAAALLSSLEFRKAACPSLTGRSRSLHGQNAASGAQGQAGIEMNGNTQHVQLTLLQLPSSRSSALFATSLCRPVSKIIERAGSCGVGSGV